MRTENPNLNQISIAKAIAKNLTNCTRVLTVGSDWSSGKMTTVFEFHQAAKDKGLNSVVLATGHTGLR